MEKNYKKVLEEQLSDLDGEIGRQAKERAQAKGTLTSRVMQYAQNHGVMDTGIKVGVLTGVAYAAGVVLPIVTGPFVAGTALLAYGGKKLIYDPFIKKKK